MPANTASSTLSRLTDYKHNVSVEPWD